MNEQKLTKYLASYKEWLTKNPAAANEAKQEQMEAQQKAHAFTKERLLSLSEDDLFEYLSPLWAMAMWGNKHYQINNIIEANGIELLRKQFANLIYGEADIEKRWDEFRSEIKGIGPAIMSELLCKTYPAQYLLWNKKTYTGFKTLNIDNLPRYEARLDGEMYAQLSGIGRELLAKSQEYGYNEICDLLALNYFIWTELQDDSTDCTIPDKEEELIASSKKDATFIHNDIRDKVAEIGHCLGFRAEVEKKVAAGAVVDAIWEVTIGNMGRVIYVFEVQTSGAIDSLILNLLKAKENKAVQGIVAVTDQKQIERIKKEIESLSSIKNEVKFWDYTEVLRIHEALQFVNESINRLGLVPNGL